MKKLLLYIAFIVCLIAVLFYLFNLNKSESRFMCNQELNVLEQSIKNIFEADSVHIEFVELKEEAFFPLVRGPLVKIINATTGILDFKSISLNNHEGFDNYLEIKDSLRMEGMVVVDMLKANCELRDSDEIIIWFGKGYKNNRMMSRFGINYKLSDE